MSDNTTGAPKPHPAESWVGNNIEYRHQPAGKPERVRRGVVLAWERTPATIVDMQNNICWPSFRFKIKPEDGSRAFWTAALPNTDEPRPYRK